MERLGMAGETMGKILWVDIWVDGSVEVDGSDRKWDIDYMEIHGCSFFEF